MNNSRSSSSSSTRTRTSSRFLGVAVAGVILAVRSGVGSTAAVATSLLL